MNFLFGGHSRSAARRGLFNYLERPISDLSSRRVLWSVEISTASRSERYVARCNATFQLGGFLAWLPHSMVEDQWLGAVHR